MDSANSGPPAISTLSTSGNPSKSVGLIGALLVLLTMVVCYMVLTVYSTEPSTQDGFLADTVYRPSCSNSWVHNRSERCSGVTRGQMPSIDDVMSALPGQGRRFPLIGNARRPMGAHPCCRV